MPKNLKNTLSRLSHGSECATINPPFLYGSPNGTTQAFGISLRRRSRGPRRLKIEGYTPEGHQLSGQMFLEVSPTRGQLILEATPSRGIDLKGRLSPRTLTSMELTFWAYPNKN